MDYTESAQEAKRLSAWIIAGLVAGIVVLIVGTVVWNFSQYAAIDSFAKCAQKYPVTESYPQQCRTPDGKVFVNTSQQ